MHAAPLSIDSLLDAPPASAVAGNETTHAAGPRVLEPCTATGSDVLTLERIFEEGVAVASWRRAPLPSIVAALDESLPHEERVVRETLRAAAPDLAVLQRSLGSRAADAVAPWLRELVELYAILADATEVGLRLCVTRGRPCPRFHVDRVGLRLICTLRGPGTEWLDHAHVDRRLLGAPAADDGESGLLLPGAVVQRLAPFDVGVFKGESWPGNAGRGAVHRSPPSDGSWRLLVTLDAL